MADLDVAIKILKNKEEYEEDPSEKDLVFMRFIREASKNLINIFRRIFNCKF